MFLSSLRKSLVEHIISFLNPSSSAHSDSTSFYFVHSQRQESPFSITVFTFACCIIFYCNICSLTITPAGPDFLNMFSKLFPSAFLSTILVSSLASATQIDKRSVGALTPLSSKTKVCNILDYGGVADNSTDIGPAIKSAFASCAISGGATIYIPPGSYSRETTLRKLTYFNTNSPQFRQE
jgi:hypothetical protein